MAATPLISIIVPVYNVEHVLDRCIASLVAQTYPNLEIILVDDGSPDASAGKCDAWNEKDQRIRVIHQENRGLSEARNTGIDAATGEYLAFVDSDDYVEPEYIESLLSAAQRNNADMVVCSYVDEDEHCHPKEETPFVEHEMNIDSHQCMEGIYRHMEFVLAWNKLYKAKIWETYRYPSGKLHEDEFAFHHIVTNCDSVVLVPDRLYHYVDNATSIMHTAYSIRNLDVIEARIERLRFFLLNGYANLVPTTFRFVMTGFYRATQLSWSQPDVRRRIEGILALFRALPPARILRILPMKDRISYLCMYWCPFAYQRLKKLILKR